MTLPPFITKYAKVFTSRKGSVGPNPTRDWLILLAFFLGALVASIGWNLWFFSATLSGEGTASEGAPAVEADAGSIERARALFEARALEEGRYRSEYRFVDPAR